MVTPVPVSIAIIIIAITAISSITAAFPGYKHLPAAIDDDASFTAGNYKNRIVEDQSSAIIENCAVAAAAPIIVAKHLHLMITGPKADHEIIVAVADNAAVDNYNNVLAAEIRNTQAPVSRVIGCKT